MFLVDTNVLSETSRPRPSPSVLAFLDTQPTVALSVVSLMELETGILLAPRAKRDRLSRWLEAITSSVSIVVVPIDAPIARTAARLRASHRSRSIPTEDLLVAATAIVRGEVLATRNTRDFVDLGVPLLDPFAQGGA